MYETFSPTNPRDKKPSSQRLNVGVHRIFIIDVRVREYDMVYFYKRSRDCFEYTTVSIV